MRRILGIVAVCAVGSTAWGQQIAPAFGGYTGGGGFVDTVVYDNSASPLGFLILGEDRDWGDGVTLAGTDRVVTNINLLVHNLGSAGTADVQVRLFVGGDATPGDPGAMLWDSGLIVGLAIDPGLVGYDFAVPNVTVPGEITWTLAISNVSNGGAGIGSRFVDPPTIGSSIDSLWDHDGGVWTAHVFSGLGGASNFGATITAIPTPGSLSLLAIGGLAMLRRRR